MLLLYNKKNHGSHKRDVLCGASFSSFLVSGRSRQLISEKPTVHSLLSIKHTQVEIELVNIVEQQSQIFIY